MAVGGGAVIDTVGFAAATAHRGIRLIRVPTTVLAQADAEEDVVGVVVGGLQEMRIVGGDDGEPELVGQAEDPVVQLVLAFRVVGLNLEIVAVLESARLGFIRVADDKFLVCFGFGCSFPFDAGWECCTAASNETGRLDF